MMICAHNRHCMQVAWAQLQQLPSFRRGSCQFKHSKTGLRIKGSLDIQQYRTDGSRGGGGAAIHGAGINKFLLVATILNPRTVRGANLLCGLHNRNLTGLSLQAQWTELLRYMLQNVDDKDVQKGAAVQLTDIQQYGEQAVDRVRAWFTTYRDGGSDK